MTVPDHPLVSSLFGMEVPRVVAGRFMHFLRSKTARCTTSTNAPRGACIHMLDLLRSNHSTSTSTCASTATDTPNALVTIKYSQEDSDCFREWTYYLVTNPSSTMREFVGFVKKNYCKGSVDAPSASVPFTRIQIGCQSSGGGGAMTLDLDDLMPEKLQAGNWVMLTGLPDTLPLFFFAATTNQGTTVFLNHNANFITRMQQWTSSPSSIPSTVNLYSLSHLPAVVLN